MDSPFELLSCSWPRPVKQEDGKWVSEPEWDVPPMRVPPVPQWKQVNGETYLGIDWREHFRGDLHPSNREISGQMRFFQVVFSLRVNGTGRLEFLDDDGCVIRRNGDVIHADRSAHQLTASSIEVRVGDHLEVAQWQLYGDWLWCARLTKQLDPFGAGVIELKSYRDAVNKKVQAADGPPLKTYFSGTNPIRTVVSLYSMFLNGYQPSRVHIFGDYQWDSAVSEFFREHFPFANIVPTENLIHGIDSLAPPGLSARALKHWFIMKACVSLLAPPNEFLYMDDDIFILDEPTELRASFTSNNLVYGPDWDHGESYLAIWGTLLKLKSPLPTGRMNAGLYALRNRLNPSKIALELNQMPPTRTSAWQWEQGYMACRFAHEECHELSSQRYFYPVFDGLPGGIRGYDYANNPCGFASIHFGGLALKPTESDAIVLMHDILGRRLRRQ